MALGPVGIATGEGARPAPGLLGRLDPLEVKGASRKLACLCALVGVCSAGRLQGAAGVVCPAGASSCDPWLTGSTGRRKPLIPRAMLKLFLLEGGGGVPLVEGCISVDRGCASGLTAFSDFAGDCLGALHAVQSGSCVLVEAASDEAKSRSGFLAASTTDCSFAAAMPEPALRERFHPLSDALAADCPADASTASNLAGSGHLRPETLCSSVLASGCMKLH